MNDTPEKSEGTAPLNFGGSSPFTSGQTEPLTDVTPEVAEAAPEAVAEVPTEDVAENNVSATETPAEEPNVLDVGLDNMPPDEVATEVETPVVPEGASTIPAEELAPTAEVPATPQTELEVEVAKKLEAHAGNPAEPAELPVIASSTDDEIDNAIKERDALNAKIEDGQKAQRQDVLGQIKKVIETYKIPLAEVGEYLGIKGTRKGSKAKPKYRNPDDGKEWSGRGKEPLWIKGKDRAGFLITP